MTRIFKQELLEKSIVVEKAQARKDGRIAGFKQENIPHVKEILAGTVAVINETGSSVSEEEAPVSSPAPSVSLDTINQLIANALEPLQSESRQLREQLQSVNDENTQLRSQVSTLTVERNQFEVDSRVLRDIGRLEGRAEIQAPMINTQTSVNDSPKRLADELIGILNDQIRSKTQFNIAGYSDTTGQIYANQRNPIATNTFIHECFKEAKRDGRTWQESQLIKDVEQWFKANGYLSGRIINAAGPTTGATGSAPNIFLDVLSSIMRLTHNQANIFWQFTTTIFDETSAPGKNILVPRVNHLPQPTNLSDYLIANTTTFNPIIGPVGSTADSQNLEVTTVPISCSQWGIGRGVSVGTRPVFIPEFHQAVALISLLDAVERVLAQNYYAFEELMIRSEYEKATTVIYNDGGSVTTTPADIATADNGTCSRHILSSAYSEMHAQRMPTLSDGCYIAALNSIAAGQLKRSYDAVIALPSTEEIEEVGNMLRQVSGFEIGRVSGYLGRFEGYHCFMGNSFGVGAAGASPTVQNTVFGASVGTRVTADSFLFAAGAVGRGIALPMEIRSQGAPFEQGTAYAWVERGGCGPLDLDASLDASQQTRVWKLRTTRSAV